MNNAAIIAQTMNNAGFDVLPMEMDLSSRSSILSLIDEAQKHGEISMLVNVAGVSVKSRTCFPKNMYDFSKKHVRVFGKSRTCFLENTYMKSNKYYGVSIQLPINGLHIGLSKRAYCIICF